MRGRGGGKQNIPRTARKEKIDEDELDEMVKELERGIGTKNNNKPERAGIPGGALNTRNATEHDDEPTSDEDNSEGEDKDQRSETMEKAITKQNNTPREGNKRKRRNNRG